MEPTELRPQFEQQPPKPTPERGKFVEQPQAERERQPEKTAEKAEKKRADSGKRAETGAKRSFNPLRRTPPPVPQVKNELTVKIEKVLEENLAEAYQSLSPAGKQAFKIKGEKTTSAIKEMVEGGHSKARKIFNLIFEWLKMLPGINRFFLEQEAKIKTDRIMKLGERS